MRLMNTMGLKLILMLLIFVIASVCLLLTAAYVLYQADRESGNEVTVTAESIDKQLELQLLRITTGFENPRRFPDLSLWLETGRNTALCVRYTETNNNNIVRNVCRGGASSTKSWSAWFETIYRWAFRPGQKVVREITYRDQVHGTITVSPDAEQEIERAWRDAQKLMGLSAIMVTSLCTLLYFAVGRALRPARVIVTGLEDMAQGNLSTRLPNFKIMEWQRTGEAINHLTANLEKILSERKELALKLMGVQEEERRFLTRELHDEFGQCLAGLNATASSITQTAVEKCPELVPDGQNITRITSHMMDLLRNILVHLRPSDIDELGLTASLKSMVAGWNTRSGGKTQYELEVDGDFDHLPEPIPANIFRIVQECLTNVSKHSAAENAKVKLERLSSTEIVGTSISDESITLTIEDDGIANDLTFSGSSGIGLLGIRERVAALGGQLTLQANKPSGLIIHVWIPLQPIPEAPT